MRFTSHSLVSNIYFNTISKLNKSPASIFEPGMRRGTVETDSDATTSSFSDQNQEKEKEETPSRFKSQERKMKQLQTSQTKKKRGGDQTERLSEIFEKRYKQDEEDLNIQNKSQEIEIRKIEIEEKKRLAEEKQNEEKRKSDFMLELISKDIPFEQMSTYWEQLKKW